MQLFGAVIKKNKKKEPQTFFILSFILSINFHLSPQKDVATF